MSVYHRLPAPLREAGASLHGYRLRSWRYGPETDPLIAETLERDGWDAARWERWRAERVPPMLRRAAEHVPYYRRLWERRRAAGDHASPERLENWPVLSKEAVRAEPRAFVDDGCDPRSLRHEHTSGTTGTPLSLFQSRETVRTWYGISEARIRHWNGLDRRDRWAIFGGQLVVPVERARPPFWVWNAGLRQLYCSSYHLAPANVRAYVDALCRYRVRYVFGYASSLHSLSRLAAEQGIALPTMLVAIANAEPIYAYQREEIAAAFGCPVRETYGMAEMVFAASECAEGSLHAWPDVGVAEILHDEADSLVAPGESGRLVATGLVNREMPLIRYDVGDRVRFAPQSTLRGGSLRDGRRCACGRGLPILEQIEGRSDDVVVTPDGRRVGRFDPVFKADFPIREAQIVQEAPDRLVVSVVPAPGYLPEHAEELRHRVRMRVGDSVSVAVESVERIPRTKAGKFRAVVRRFREKEAAGG
jgi:phenylacetate-CoA ligase